MFEHRDGNGTSIYVILSFLIYNALAPATGYYLQ